MASRRRRPPASTQLPLSPSPHPAERLAWTGPFQPSLEARWLEALGRFRARDPLRAVWLLVPSRFLGLHLVRLAAHAGGAVNVHVLTFTDLAERILGEGRRRLPPAGDLLVLRQGLREAVPDDGYFAAVREARRFPPALAATLAELRTAGVRPEDLEAAAAVAEPASGRKLRELAGIVRRADATVAAAGFAHPTDLLWAAAARAAEAPALAGPVGLGVYGFTEWNAVERALLRAVTAWLDTVCFVPAEPGPPFEPIEGLLAWLEAEGFRVARAEGPPPVGPRALAARLFHEWPAATGTDATPDTSSLEVVAAPGEEREVREIARRMLAAAAAGVAFEAMGLLVRHPELYRSAIRDAFGAAGIPYTWGVAPRLGDTRAGRGVRLLLAARQADLSRAAVVEFLATARLREPEEVEPAEWDRLSREARIVGGGADWRRGLGWLRHRTRERGAAPARGADEEDAPLPAPEAAAVEALGRVVGTLLETVGRLPDTAPAATFARRLLQAFLRLCERDQEGSDVPEAAGPRSERRPGGRRPKAPRADGQCRDQMTDGEQVAALLAGFEALAPLETPLSLEEFGELLDAALAAPAEPGPEARQGKVFVGELHQALGLPFRLCAIPGLVEQGFPAPPRGDPILGDDERRLLHAQVAAGRPGLSLARDRTAEERLAFRLAAAAATDRLVLTYPRVDVQSGRPRVPSAFLLRLAEAATGTAYDFSRFETEFPPLRRVPLVPAPPDAVAAPIDRREWLLAQATRARAAGTVGRAAGLALLPRAARGRAALEAREQDERASAWDGLLPADLLPVLTAWHRPAAEPVAATPLEAWATCPFRYYLAHVLGIRPPREPERLPTLRPADRGRLLHAVLADVYAACGEAGLLPLRPETVAEARRHLEVALERAEARFPDTGLAPFWRGERARLLLDLAAHVEAEAREAGAWVPTGFEVAFGTGEAEPAVAYTLADRRAIAFRGRLDRLDLSPDGTRARVIDYKGGRGRGLASARLARGTALQLPIYRLAAEAISRARGLEARVEEAQYYFLTRRGGRRRVRFTAADWTARRADFDTALATILDGIAAGCFVQNPSVATCRACDYQPACGAERERIEWVARKRGDPARAAHARLEEIE